MLAAVTVEKGREEKRSYRTSNFGKEERLDANTGWVWMKM